MSFYGVERGTFGHHWSLIPRNPTSTSPLDQLAYHHIGVVYSDMVIELLHVVFHCLSQRGVHYKAVSKGLSQPMIHDDAEEYLNNQVLCTYYVNDA